MPAGTSWRTRAWTLAACNTTSATRISSTPFVTPSFHPTGSATSGEISWIGARRRHRGSELARFGASQTSLDVRVADATPPGGGLLDSENYSCPLSQKPVQKRFLPQKGGSLSVEGVFA